MIITKFAVHSISNKIIFLICVFIASLWTPNAHSKPIDVEGQIIFSSKPTQSLDSPLYDEVNLKRIKLNTDKNLYFQAYFKQSLSNYLRALCQKSTSSVASCENSELVKKGNFQFSFFVNDKSVYTENLNFGAGLFEEKTVDKRIVKPLFSERNEDSWGRFLWMRFMHFGGEEALTEGSHQLRIEIRPYQKGDSLETGPIMASGSIAIDVVKPIATKEQIAIQKIAEGSGWELSNESFDREKIEALNKKIAQNDFKAISGIVVIKSGKLLLEQYYNDSSREALHNPRSVSKSIAGSMLGIALNEKHISSVDATLSDFYHLQDFENVSKRKADVSLKALLTMSSGFNGNDSDYNSIGNEENMYPTADWVKFALDLPMTTTNDENANKWQYFTAGVVVLGDILHKNVPTGLENYAKTKLFAPLGINNYQWQYTPQEVANTAGGLQMRALDFAKYGQLYKNDGKYKNKQIIPSSWVKQSLSPVVSREGGPNNGNYGYLFWHDKFKMGDKEIELAYATGNGGNKIYIFKNLPLVIVITAKAYNKPYAHSQVNQMMFNYILPAILK